MRTKHEKSFLKSAKSVKSVVKQPLPTGGRANQNANPAIVMAGLTKSRNTHHIKYPSLTGGALLGTKHEIRFTGNEIQSLTK